MWSPLRDRSVVSPLETWNVPVEQSIGVSFVCESAIADKDPPFRRPEFDDKPGLVSQIGLARLERREKSSKFVTNPLRVGTHQSIHRGF